ncbi:helix-turn-helix domain-containing protein [Catenulispora acidiphila]
MGPNGLTRAIELYAEGRTLVQIAREFGVAKKTIRKRLVEGGVVIRRGGRASWESR